MTKLSKNFTLSEFEVSSEHPHLVEPVPAHLVPNIKALVDNVLQPICDATGWRCRITSGYRGDRLNKAVGGTDTSQHPKAEAADTQYYTVDKAGKTVFIPPHEVAGKAKELKLKYDQMILYPGMVHFSHTTKRANRIQLLYNWRYKGKRL